MFTLYFISLWFFELLDCHLIMRLLSIYFGTLTSFILANPIVHNLNDPISGLEIRSSSQSIDKLVYAFENLSESDDASCMSGHTAEKRSEGNHLDRSRDVSVVRRLSNACPVKGFRVIPAPTTEPTLNPERKPTPKKSPTKSPDEPLNVPPSQDTNSHCLDSFFKKIVTCGGPEINASPDFFSIVPGVVNCVRGWSCFYRNLNGKQLNGFK